MGIFDAILGNASEANMEEVSREYAKLLAETEVIEQAYKLVRDLFIFTNRRLIIVDIQGITGKKTAYHSIPYKNISHFSIETAGHFDLDAELKIWLSGSGSAPIEKAFNKNLDIYKLQRILASYILQ